MGLVLILLMNRYCSMCVKLQTPPLSSAASVIILWYLSDSERTIALVQLAVPSVSMPLEFLFLLYWFTLYIITAIYIKGIRESRGLMVESRTRNPKVVSSSLGPAGILGGGSEYPALSPPSISRRGALEQGTEPGLPGRRSINGCVCSLLCVCTWMGKCRARIPEYGSPYLAVCHFTFTFILSYRHSKQ